MCYAELFICLDIFDVTCSVLVKSSVEMSAFSDIMELDGTSPNINTYKYTSQIVPCRKTRNALLLFSSCGCDRAGLKHECFPHICGVM